MIGCDSICRVIGPRHQPSSDTETVIIPGLDRQYEAPSVWHRVKIGHGIGMRPEGGRSARTVQAATRALTGYQLQPIALIRVQTVVQSDLKYILPTER